MAGTNNSINNYPVPLAGGTMTGNLILNADPSVALGAATKQYVDAVSAGYDYKNPCYAGTIGTNIAATYSNGASGVGATLISTGLSAFTLDGTTPALNARILIKDQSNSYENGIYSLTSLAVVGVTPWTLTRTSDYNQPGEIAPMDVVQVLNGTVNAPNGSPTSWEQTQVVSAIGSGNPIVFQFFSGGISGVPVGGTGTQSFVSYMPVIGGTSSTNPLASANGGTLVAGNVLTYVSGSAAPTWQAPGGGGGGLTWLASVTASTSATLNFDNLLSSSYDNYMIVFENITPDTNNVGFGAQFGIGATPTYQTSGYMGACGYMDSAGPGSIASSSSYATLCTTGLPNTGTTQLSGSININNINNTVNNQGLSGTLTGYYNLASSICSFIPGVQWAGASAVTSIRFLMSTGNILTGTIKLYGLKN